MTEPRDLEAFYDDQNRDMDWAPAVLRPHAATTNAYDDTARLLEKIPTRGKALEIGCGTGKFSVSIADNFDDLSDSTFQASRSIALEKCKQSTYQNSTKRLHTWQQMQMAHCHSMTRNSMLC